MVNIHAVFTIARRERRRVFSRFQGRSRPIVLLTLLLAGALSYLVFTQGATVNQGIYRIGLSPDSPFFHDGRFHSSTFASVDGYAALARGEIDVFIDGAHIAVRGDDRSQFAAGALAQVLEEQELLRIVDQYTLEQAFPLRIATTILPARSDMELVNGDGQLPVLLDKAGAANPTAANDEMAVEQQLVDSLSDGRLPDLSFDNENMLIPSLSEPPIPFAQVVIAFLYVMPIAFISIFFMSSFMDEKHDKRITVLIAAPITPGEIILGKMLPYLSFSLLTVVLMTLFQGGNILLALLIFTPVIFFIFAIYLIVPLLYRSYKDTTFISMLAVTALTSYLIFPAMFSGVNDFSYMSPLTLVVKMYRGEGFSLQEYLFSAVPMAAIFSLALFISTRVLNEEYLLSHGPIRRKLVEAIYLTINHQRPYLSVLLLSLFFIPMIYIIQLVTLAISLNLPLRYALVALMTSSIFVEEIGKSIGVLAVFRRLPDRPMVKIVALSAMSALGFLIGEKLLLFLSLSAVSDSAMGTAMFSSGLLLIPMLAHFIFTSVTTILHLRYRVRYSLALLAATALHTAYNFIILGAAL